MPHTDPEHALKIALATALRERDEARSRAADVQSANLGLVRRLEEEKARAGRMGDRAWAAEQERDDLRAEVRRLREAAAALRDGYDHVAHCRECGEMSVEHCAEAEGENSDAAKAIGARTSIDAALASGGDRG